MLFALLCLAFSAAESLDGWRFSNEFGSYPRVLSCGKESNDTAAKSAFADRLFAECNHQAYTIVDMAHMGFLVMPKEKRLYSSGGADEAMEECLLLILERTGEVYSTAPNDAHYMELTGEEIDSTKYLYEADTDLGISGYHLFKRAPYSVDVMSGKKCRDSGSRKDLQTGTCENFDLGKLAYVLNEQDKGKVYACIWTHENCTHKGGHKCSWVKPGKGKCLNRKVMSVKAETKHFKS